MRPENAARQEHQEAVVELSGNVRIASLWRYPVKSMAGEQVLEIDVSSRGLNGDRAFALIDKCANKVGSAKNAGRFGPLLKCRAHFSEEPGPNGPGSVTMAMPDGTTVHSEQPDLEAVLNASFGPDIALVSQAPEGLILEIAAGTLGGKHAATTELPVSSASPAGTLFNYAAVHLVTKSTLRQFEKAFPSSQFEARRFRPNLILDCDDEGFPENAWIGQTLAVGADLQLRISIPCPRCVVPTLPLEDLPHDPSILRSVAELNSVDLGDFGTLPCLGIYADVIQPGRIRQGDAIRILS